MDAGEFADMHISKGHLRSALLAGIAAAALLPAAAQAQTAREAELEARLSQLEAAVTSLRAELEATRAQGAAAIQQGGATAAATQTQVAAMESRVAAVEARPQPLATGFRVGSTTVHIGGYVKLDVLASSFSGGDPAANSLVNDYYFPAQIPVGGSGEGVNLTTSVRETRLLVRTETPVANGAVRGHVEVDFLDTPLLGNQRVSNSFVPRVRRAFISYGNLTFGQDWSTFQNVAVLPERVDFIGPTEGTVFERQPLVRYRSGNFTFAVENPETTATLGTVSAEADDDVAPDVVLRYDGRASWGSFALAGIGRMLSVNNSGTPSPLGTPGTIDDSRFGWGLSASTVVEGGANRFTAMATVGEGIGRYVGLNLRDDVVINPVSGTLAAPMIYAGFASFRHSFSPKWKAVVTGSGYHSDTPGFASPLLTRSVWSGNVDLLYTPVASLILGFGFRYAERKLESGAVGRLRRLQFSVQYNF